jgi:hypothetical protein
VTAFASDVFTDVAGTTLGGHDANWLLITSYAISCKTNGSAVYPTAFGNSAYRYAATPPAADYSVSLDVVLQSGTGPVLGGPIGRASSSAATFYHAQYNVSAGAWRLWKSVAGTFTQLGSDVSQSLTTGTPYRCKLEMIGTAIKLYVDGVQKISVTDSSISAAGYPGLRMGQSAGSVGGTTGLQLDNFSADPIAASSTDATIAVTERADTVAITATQTDNYTLNVAASANGGVASASSTIGGSSAANGNDGVIGASTASTTWTDSTPGSFPDTFQVLFDSTYTIAKVIVYSAQDGPSFTSTPSDSLTASVNELVTFDVQGWNGSSWDTLASISGNNLVKRTIWFAPYTTDRVRLSISAVGTSYSIVDELEAYALQGANTATIAVAESADVVAIGAKSLNVASIAVAERADAVALSAKAVNVGALAATEAPDVIALSGGAGNAATLAATEAADVVALSGHEIVSAMLAAVEAPDVVAIYSIAGNTALIDVRERADAVAIEGSVIELATIAVRERPDAVAIQAREGMVATLAVQERADTVHLGAKAVNVASVGVTERSDAVAISAGSFVVGSLAGFELPDVVAIEASQIVNATIALLENADVVAITATGGTIISLPACVRASDSALGLKAWEQATRIAASHRAAVDLLASDSTYCGGGECSERC